MPPVGAALAAIGGAFGVGAPLAGTTFLAGLYGTAGTVGFGAIFARLAAGVALSALSRALMPKPDMPVGGTKVSMTFGEDQPQSFILGRACTSGDLVYHGSHGKDGDTPNAYYTQVIELSDLPAKLRRVWINGEWVTLGKTADTHGFPVMQYRRKSNGKDHLWVKFYDGTQTIADAHLLAVYGSSERPWKSTAVGRGICYAIVTARFSRDLHRQRPECRFELEAVHYDPRKDTTAGGSGGQRWSKPATWKPTTNLAVLAYNVLRGVRDPITGAFLWGGQGIAARDLPASTWFAAMNVCDQAIAKAGGGTEAQYRGGLEVRVDTEPASVLEELVKGMQGVIGEMAGQWLLHAGPPSAPVYSFTDDDVIVTSPDQFDPFPALDVAYNGVSAQYSEPEDGWTVKDAPLRLNSVYEAEDGGRRQIASLQFPAVFSGTQVQRLMTSGLKDQRRFRRHTLILPPEAYKLGLLDDISWSSARNGYIGKAFSLDAIETLPNGCAMVALRERDPLDYDWSPSDELPTAVGPNVRPPVIPQVGDFSVEPAVVKDSTGASRRPAILLKWSDSDNVDAVRYRVRLAADGSHVPGNGAGAGGDGSEVVNYLTINGARMLVSGNALTYRVFDNEDALQVYITDGIVAATAYEVQAIFAPTTNRVWSEWMPVTTPDIRLTEGDLADTIRAKLQTAFDNAAAAGEQMVALNNRVDDVEDTISGLSTEVLDRAEAIADALAGIDGAAVLELTGVAIAGLRRGWALDPTFRNWTGGALDNWSDIGTASYGAQDTDGSLSSTAIKPQYLSSLVADVPAGAGIMNLSAASDVAAEMPGADPALEYVVVSVLFYAPSGSLAGGRLRAEWWNGSAWVRGHAFGENNSQGNLDTKWGFAVSATRLQSAEVIFRRPVASPTKVRLWCDIKQSSPTSAVKVRIDYLDLRPATAAEIAAHVANGYTDTQISELELEITGPSGAIAAAMTTVRSEFNAADAIIASSVAAVSTAQGAQASRIDKIEATWNDGNLVRNGRFADGARAAGVKPDWWTNWPTNWQVVARGSIAGAVAATSPTPFFAGCWDEGWARAVTGQPVTPGNLISASCQCAAGGNNPATGARIRIVAAWLDAAGSQIGSNDVREFAFTTFYGWVKPAFADFVAPANAASMDLWVYRPAGDWNVSFTSLEARFIDVAARALITQAASAAANANSAIATLNTTVATEFGGSFAAFASAVATSASFTDKAASAYVLRAQAGAGSAGLGIFAWDDETGVGGAVRVDGAFLAPQSVGAGEVVVTDLGYNCVPDNQIQSANAWGNKAAGFSVRKTASLTTAESLGELRWTHSAGAGTVTSLGPVFAVRPGQVYTLRYQAARLSGTWIRCWAGLRLSNKSGDFVDRRLADGVWENTGGLYTRETVVTIPAGAYQAQWAFTADKDNSDGDIRFFAPSAIRREDGTTLITPSSVTTDLLAAKAVVAAKVDTISLGAVTAWVGTLTIAGNAVTVPIFAQRTSTFTVTSTSYQTAMTFNVPMSQAGLLHVNASVAFQQRDGWLSGLQGMWGRVLIDGTEVFSGWQSMGTGVVPLGGAKNVAAGNRTVQVQARATVVGAPGVDITRISCVAVGAMR